MFEVNPRGKFYVLGRGLEKTTFRQYGDAVKFGHMKMRREKIDVAVLNSQGQFLVTFIPQN